MILLNKCGKITVDNNKTNITFPFEIKDDFKSINDSLYGRCGKTAHFQGPYQAAYIAYHTNCALSSGFCTARQDFYRTTATSG